MADQTTTSKTDPLTIGKAEKSRPAAVDRESSASRTSTSSRKSVQFVDEEGSILNLSTNQASPAVFHQHNKAQSSRCSSSAASSVTSSRKKVRFVDDDMEKPHSVTFPQANTPDNTDKKNVKLANDELRSQEHHTEGSPNATELCPQTSFQTLLDADTSLATPLEDPDSPFAPDPPASSYSPAIQSPTSPSFPSPELHPNPIPTPTSPHHQHIAQEDINTSALPLDPGERDALGRILVPNTEACEKCGGKVVWATKGEWLLICEGCGEPQ